MAGRAMHRRREAQGAEMGRVQDMRTLRGRGVSRRHRQGVN